ncbi:MAG TPA: translocation/assembly module TamB domain-containing protein [Nevskiaceae bacterium]|nr:translocation/assembly module TamB domain-containing protein [Nevskiaceae bacterium]
MSWKRAGRISGWIAGAIVVLFLIILGVLAAALTSERGLRGTMTLVSRLTHDALKIGSVQGVITGTSEWRDVEFVTSAGLRLQIKAIHLRIARDDLWLPRLHVESLELDGVALVLPVSQAPPRTQPILFPTHLPIDVIADSVVIADATLQQGDAVPFHLDRVALAGRWIGDELEIDKLAGGLKQTGPLEISAKAQMKSDRLEIEKLSLKGPGELDASGTFSLGAAPNDLELKWKGAHWPLVVVEGPATIADVAGDATLKGPLTDYRFELTIGAAVQQMPAKIAARGGGNLQSMKFDALRLDAQKGSAALQGVLAWQPALRADLQGDIANLDPAAFVPDWPGEINGKLSTHTTVREDGTPHIAFEVAIDHSKLRGQSVALTTRGNTDGKSARLDELVVRTGSGSLSGSGEVAWSPALAANADAKLADIDPGAFLPQWSGKLNGAATVRTEVAGGVPDVRFTLDVDHSQLRGYPLTANARGSWKARVLRLDEASLHSGQTRLTASGQVTPPFDLVAKLQSPDLLTLHPDLGGQVDVDLKLQGPLEQPHLVARGSGRNLRFRGNRVAKLDVDADVDPKVASHAQIDVVDAVAGVQIHRARFTAKGLETYHYLALDAETERGDLDVAAEGGFDRRKLEWGGYLTAMRIAPERLPDWALEKSTPILIGRKRQSIEPACLSGKTGRVCTRLEQNVTGQGLRLYWDLHQVQLATFKPLAPSDTEISGQADGDGYVEIAGGDVAAIEAGVKLTGVRVARPNMPAFEMLPSTIKADQQNGRLHALADLKLAQGSLNADVAAAPGANFSERALSGTIRVDVPDLGFVSTLSSQLRQVGGRVHGELDLAGTPGLPRLRGDVALTDGHARLVTPGIQLQDVQLHLTGNGEGPLAIDGAMKSGDGALSVGGNVDPARAPPRADLKLAGENFQAVATPDARIWVTPDLHLVSDDTGIHLDGKLAVPRAEITPRKGIGDQGVAVSSDQVIVGAEPKKPASVIKVYSTVELALGDNVKFTGFGLTTDLGGGVTIYEQPEHDASAQGVLVLNNGSYKAYGQNLNIETGRLIFDGPVTKPAVDLYATRHPQSDVTVGVRVRGTLNKPQLSLQSDPAMPREEQLSWLVLGRPLDASSASDRSALTQAALSLGLSGGDYFAQRIGKGIGLDTLTIGSVVRDNAVAADAGTIQGSQASLNRGAYQDQTQAAQLTLGKYLTPKLFVSYGVSLFQPGQTFRLLYDLGHGFKLQSETGVASGADLVYTFERGK